MRWQVQEAKQRFSELLRAAATGEPQIVTRHGEEIAVVMTMTEYRRLRDEDQQPTLVEYLLKRPAEGAALDDDFHLERDRGRRRDEDLFD
ncbi:type II toxin-antitoxin system Phd/YefM family antitoxin [Paractinoplanes rhizophilus]|jgi:prevent-host-death family protein|uniref:Antitoxin n=1 Tax=Paractinoplanes rhizophilus TaxID=1416877 RepID=A0ABW2HIV2_9ACTN|nr:type II toxin-antitoxin system Phd/YefM family antitoxin [Actinoplanes sp.]